jgi:hypothetical protein
MGTLTYIAGIVVALDTVFILWWAIVRRGSRMDDEERSEEELDATSRH